MTRSVMPNGKLHNSGVERQTAIQLRSRDPVRDDLLRQIEHELDLS